MSGSVDWPNKKLVDSEVSQQTTHNDIVGFSLLGITQRRGVRIITHIKLSVPASMSSMRVEI